MEGGLRLSIRSLALAVIPSYWRATSRGCHTRHRADLCNFVCLCSCLEKRNYSPLIEGEVPAFVSLKKLQFKNKPSCRDHCITARHRRLLLRSKTRGGDNQGSVPGQGRPWVHPRPKGDGRQSVSRDRRRRDRGAAQRHRNSLLAAPALQQRWPRPPPPPPLLSRRRPSSPFSPRAEALSERRRAPGCAFLLRHLLLLLLPQWRLHLPLVAASVPAPGLLALLRLAPSTRRPAKHRAQKRPPPARPVS